VKKYASCLAIALAAQSIAVGVAFAPRRVQGAGPLPNYSGTWIEMAPQRGPAMRLQLTQEGSRIEVRLSYTGTFTGEVFVATIQSDDTARWTLGQSCVAQFRKPGYNYDNPGENLIRLSLSPPTDGSTETVLLYTQFTKWNLPCDGHPIGTERISKTLQRVRSAG